MSELFFTADTHFGHRNVIKYCNRPFETVEQMDQTIIDRWNSMVSPSDVIYHLGDFTFKDHLIEQYVSQLNGKIHLVLGNHDKKVNLLKPYFASVSHYIELRSVKPNIIMFHYAMRVWNKRHYGTWHLYGHSHGSLPDNNDKSLDVGVDTNDFYPYSYQQLQQIMEQRDKFGGQQTNDHHK